MIRLTLLFLLILFKTEAQTSVLNIADSLYVNGNYSQAIKQYKLHKNPSEVYNKLAKSYMAIGNYDDALQNYKASIEVHPDDMLLKFEYARLLSKTKKFDAASKTFNELILTDDKNPNYYYELGLVLEQLKDSTVQVAFNNAYQLDKTHQKAIFKIAKSYLKKRKYELADSYINVGLKSYENNVELISLKAQNYYWKQNYRESAKWFEKLIMLGESSEFIYEKLSLCYVKHYDYKNALKYRLKVLEFNPNDALSCYVIGTYYYELNDFEQAEKYISKALLLMDQPLDKEYLKLSTVLNRQKKYKESIKAANKAIEEKPDNEFSHFHLAMTLADYYADYDAKIKVFEDFLKKFPESKIKEFTEKRISDLKKEKFLKEGEKKN